MIINLVGPPTAGKSTFAAKFVLEHPWFKYCPIDEYRIEYEDEERSWFQMSEDVIHHRHCILESCGMGWRLGQLLNSPTLRRRPLITIEFTADRKILLDRLQNRQKRPLPPPFRPEDEFLALNYSLEYYNKEMRVNYCIDTSVPSKKEVYEHVNQFIQREILRVYGQQEIRWDKFPDTPEKGTDLARQL